MRQIIKTLVIATSVLSCAAFDAEAAEPRCTEGRTSAGVCINPHLAKLMRHQAIVMTQPKISYSSPLVMPGDSSIILPQRGIYETLQLYPTALLFYTPPPPPPPPGSTTPPTGGGSTTGGGTTTGGGSTSGSTGGSGGGSGAGTPTRGGGAAAPIR